MVAEPEAGSRRIIEFMGLPWDDVCLNFHEARRTMRSAANWQVRRLGLRPVGCRKAYERHLGPLIHALAEARGTLPKGMAGPALTVGSASIRLASGVNERGEGGR